MNTLAIDTCDRRGSVSVRIDGRTHGLQIHAEEDYSSWLLPAVERSLGAARKNFTDLNLLAVATGPGSFTGVRIGLVAVKAWAEVYGIPVVGVSRLEASPAQFRARAGSRQAMTPTEGRFSRDFFADPQANLSGKAMNSSLPTGILSLVREQTSGDTVHWVSLDPNLIGQCGSSEAQPAAEQTFWPAAGRLVNFIGEIGEERAAHRQCSNILELDANYVRRSDAEIFWKGPAHRAG